MTTILREFALDAGSPSIMNVAMCLSLFFSDTLVLLC